VTFIRIFLPFDKLFEAMWHGSFVSLLPFKSSAEQFAGYVGFSCVLKWMQQNSVGCFCKFLVTDMIPRINSLFLKFMSGFVL